MKSGWRAGTRSLVALTGLLALGLFALPASAYHRGTVKVIDAGVTETIDLPINNWTAYTFTLDVADTISYDIRVTSGGAIDVYFVPPDGLENYSGHAASVFRVYDGVDNQRVITGTFSGQTGAVSVIVDNTDVTQGGADPIGSVRVAVTLQKGSNLLLGGLIFILCGIVFLAIALVMVFVLRRRKAAEPVPPVPYSGAPPSAYSAPPPVPPPAAPEGSPPVSPPPPSP